MARKAGVKRKTSETDVSIELNLDGRGETSVSTGLKFFDHMLNSFGKHSLIDLKIKATGDLEVDEHHLVEDVAICLGKTLNKALGSKRGIRRFGYAIVPMDDSVAVAAIDFGGRAYLILKLPLRGRKVGDVNVENFEHFMDTLSKAMEANVYIEVKGRNDHHKVEAMFKALALSVREAVRKEPRAGIPSTKGRI